MGGTLVVENVVKTFKGFRAVDEVSFTVSEGSFTALLGPNGSGKSTTLKMCTNLFQPDSGRITVNGTDVSKNAVAAMYDVGCVIETPEIYPDVTGRKFLEYLGMVCGMSAESAGSETDRVLEIVGMLYRADEKIKGYSKGMKQRIVLAQSLLGSPSLLILDEPTSGLDPGGSAEFRRILTEMNRDGMTILMSSHMLHEVEGLCDCAVILNHGRTAAQGKLSDIIGMSRITVSVAGAVDGSTVERIASLPNVSDACIVSEGISVRLDGGPDKQADLVRDLIEIGVRVYSVRKEDPLEEAFMDIIGGERR